MDFTHLLTFSVMLLAKMIKICWRFVSLPREWTCNLVCNLVMNYCLIMITFAKYLSLCNLIANFSFFSSLVHWQIGIYDVTNLLFSWFWGLIWSTNEACRNLCCRWACIKEHDFWRRTAKIIIFYWRIWGNKFNKLCSILIAEYVLPICRCRLLMVYVG